MINIFACADCGDPEFTHDLVTGACTVIGCKCKMFIMPNNINEYVA
jgi:hypothetical protein